MRAVSVEQSSAEGHRLVQAGARSPPGTHRSSTRARQVWVPPGTRAASGEGAGWSIHSIPAVRAVQIGDLTSRHLALGEAFTAGFYAWASASFNVC